MTEQRCAAQHFGLWVIEPQWFTQAVRAVKDGTLKPMTADDRAKERQQRTTSGREVHDDDGHLLFTRMENGVAMIEIVGFITKGLSSFGGCSGVLIRRAVRKISTDPTISTVVLYIDSPGSRSDVPAAVVDDLKILRAAGKRLFASIDGQCSSGAYWIASACEQIWAGRADVLGCIGAFAVLTDDTGQQEQLGIKDVLVKTGRYKGLGADGKVTDDLIEDTQRELNDVMEHFMSDVAAGRKLSIETVRELADGRMHMGDKAKALGLADKIGGFDAAIQEINMITEQDFEQYAAANPQSVKKLAIVQQIEAEAVDRTKAAMKPKNATAAELKAAFPNDKDFVMDRLDVDAPMADHKIAYGEHLQAQLAKEQQRADEAERKLAEVDPALAGTRPVNTTPAPAGGDENKPMSAQRERELLAMSPLGASVIHRK